MKLRSFLGAQRRRILSSFCCRYAPLGDSGPIVSFSFDDFPRTAYTAGAPILERYGMRGTYYTAMGMMNTSNPCGEQFHAEDLYALVDAGHELASHTMHHISSRAVSCWDFQNDVQEGNRALYQATGVNPTNFAYPFGDVTLAIKSRLLDAATPDASDSGNRPALTSQAWTSSGLASARGIVPGLNGPQVDLNLLRANGLYGDIDRALPAEKLIAANLQRKSWLIFYTHDVQPNPSPYGCTPALLEAVVACAAESGARVLTVQEALQEIRAQGADRNSPAMAGPAIPGSLAPKGKEETYQHAGK
jgi:peptidoglycan/xylan/chitin deacetylase (PgdA/CDA1 family)